MVYQHKLSVEIWLPMDCFKYNPSNSTCNNYCRKVFILVYTLIMLEIKKWIEIPVKKSIYRVSSEYPFFQMEVWDSFIFTTEKKKSVATIAYEMKQVYNKWFKVRKLNEPIEWNTYWCRRVF